MFYEANRVLLLLTRCVDVGEEEGDIMATNESHHSPIVIVIHVRFNGRPTAGVMPVLAFVHGFIRHFGGFASFGRPAPRHHDTFSNVVDILLGKKVLRAVELRTIARIFPVVLAEIAIGGDNEISASGNIQVSVALGLLQNGSNGTYVAPERPNVRKLKQAGQRCCKILAHSTRGTGGSGGLSSGVTCLGVGASGVGVIVAVEGEIVSEEQRVAVSPATVAASRSCSI